MAKIIERKTKEECLGELRHEIKLDQRKTCTLKNYLISTLAHNLDVSSFSDYVAVYYLKHKVVAKDSSGGKWIFLDAINETFNSNISVENILSEEFYTDTFEKLEVCRVKSALMSLLFTMYIDTGDYLSAYKVLYKVFKNNKHTLDNFSSSGDPEIRMIVNLLAGIAENTANKENSGKSKAYIRYLKKYSEIFYQNLSVMQQDILMGNPIFVKFKNTASNIYEKCDSSALSYNNLRTSCISENVFLDLLESSSDYLSNSIKYGRYERRFQISNFNMDRMKGIFKSYLSGKYALTSKYKELTPDIKNMIDIIDKYDYKFDIFDVVADLSPKIQSAALEAQIS